MRILTKGFKALCMAVVILLCAVLFYLMVILGNPNSGAPTPEGTARARQALPQNPLYFTADTLYQVAFYMDAPIMVLPERAGFALSTIVVEEGRVAGVAPVVRQTKLTYSTPDGQTVTLITATPTAYQRVLAVTGYLPASVQGEDLLGQAGVLMQGGSQLSLHTSLNGAVYRIEGAVGLSVIRGAAGSADLLP